MRTEREKEYLQKAIDANNRQFLIISTDFAILAANKATREICSDIIGKQCFQVFYNQTEVCEKCPAIDVIKTGGSILRHQPTISEDKNWAKCRYSYPIFSSDGNLDAITLLEFDRPSREEIEEKLRRSNAFLRNLILSSVDAVMAADKTGKVQLFNQAAVEISGYSVEEALESLDIRSVYQENGAKEIMRLLRSDEHGGKGKLKSFQVDVLRKDGATIPISLNAAIVYEGDTEVGSIGFFHDLRDELKMQAELEKTQIQLLQAEKMSSLGKLAAGVAHQLNNPLGGITLFANLVMEDYKLEEGAKSDLERILQEAERCRDTVKELLEFARQTSHAIRPHDLGKAITRTLFLLENQTLFQNIEIKKTLAENIPEVPADIQQMNHVFMNIILNAAQAMEGKGILSIKTSLSQDNNHLRIEISDTGPGIPEEIITHIFDPFYTTKEEGQGTGLGLSMVYGIIEDHNGSINVESTVGLGSTFIIDLPLKSDAVEGENSGNHA